jgi:alkanesulfonate monooxygenase SsuD/methylene tetrahydromethanopterin reductase-like flavin-dependent oxidoreductase (luciferase family)
MHPRLGYLCLFDNPSAEDGRALIRQFVLVREADRMGYDDIWIGEHHGDPQWPTGSIAALLGHLAAVTSKAAIGALPLVPGAVSPERLAEDAATLDLLSKGRFQLALGSGAAFSDALQRLGLTRPAARAAVADTLAGLPAQLATTVPRAGRPALPTWVASSDPATVANAACHGAGLVAAATHTDAHVRALLAAHRAAMPEGDPRLVLARFACTAATRDEAIAIARPYLADFAARATRHGWGADRERSMARDVDALLAHSLIGSHAEVAARIRDIAAQGQVDSLAIIPTSAQFDAHKHILADFVDEVRPLCEE